ncbi:TIGR03087 family PEP-CTERM/XrtA system glycosyltransferase [candidate division KSB1 bacterium]|nr:TIGR03087 family PEP-CTERM/XrtA system glycosyltransferase [candidate division KSB1 bacterium]
MKVLFIAHRVPFPPNKGDKIRSFHILQHLARQHDVHVAVPVDNDDDRESVNELSRRYPVTSQEISARRRAVTMMKRACGSQPLSPGNFWSTRLKSQIDELATRERFDALVVFSSSMAPYATDLNIPTKIIDFCDLDSAKFAQYADYTAAPKSWLCRIESRRLARYEKSLVASFDHILLISPEEKRLFEVNGYDDKVKIMSNGVTLPALATAFSPEIKMPNIVFTGVMDYLPNVDAVCWFVKQVWKNLRRTQPDLSFYIVGKNPVKAVQELHSPQENVFVTGFVQDVAPYLHSASAFVAPIRIARGMQTKILEAMAHGIPVVSSSGSAHGIGAAHAQELLIADTPEVFERHVSLLLHDKQFARQLRDNAVNFIRDKFDWDKNLAILDELLAQKKRPTIPV